MGRRDNQTRQLIEGFDRECTRTILGQVIGLGWAGPCPLYGDELADPVLLQRLEQLRPQHIIVTIGGGTQERLGLCLRRQLSYVPSIHCIGAAIAFLSGDQVHIPVWADRYYMGWLFRSISEPKRYLPRYWDARKLFRLMVRYRDQLPELVSAER